MNPDTARSTREPETAAGRHLLERWQGLKEGHGTMVCYPLPGIIDIEAELRRSLAAKVRALPWNVAGQATAPVGGCDEEWAVGEYQSAVLRLIEGSDPASPEPERESCCSKENPHRAIPTITDRTRIARHWFDEAAVFPATKIYAASDLDAGPADDGRLRAGRLMYAVGHRDPGLAVLDIEAELRASLAADYRKMHGYPTTGATNDAVLALIEGSDPASPEECGDPDPGHPGSSCTYASGHGGDHGNRHYVWRNSHPWLAATPVAGSTIPPLDVERLARALQWITEGTPGWLAGVDQINSQSDVEGLARAIAAEYARPLSLP